MDLDIVGIITALGVGTLLKSLVDWWIKSKKEEKDKDESFTKVFRAVHEVYYVLLTLLRNCKAHRVVVLKTTNGGGRPTLTGRLYGSVIYEAFEYPLKSIKEDWQQQLLDAGYLDLLFEMNKTGSMEIFTKELAPGILKDLYESTGVVKSWIYKIHERENEYIYISVNFTELADDDPRLNNLFRTGVNRLRVLFSGNEQI